MAQKHAPKKSMKSDDLDLQLQALELQKRSKVTLGRLGYQEGMISLDDVFEVLADQHKIKERFGAQIATATHATHAALRTGEYERARRSLIDWKARVMGARKAGPWVVLTPAGRIDVRYRGLEHLLPSQAGLADLWINSYFVDSLKRLLNQLRNVA